MGWETRDRGSRYYTRSSRVEGRVVREYIGGGLAGGMAAEADRIERERRKAEEQRQKRELERLEALATPVEELSEAAEILVRAHLVDAGFHKRKGEWRRAQSA